LIHGNPDTADVWAPLMERLEHQYRCVAPDLPGFGGSAVAEDFEPCLDNMAGFVARVIRGGDVKDPVNLVVHDFGAWFGLAWAIRNPERVRRIAILNARFFSDFRWHPWARVLRTPGVGELAMVAMNRWGFRRHMQRQAPRLGRAEIDATYDRSTLSARRMALRLYRAMNSETFRGWEDSLRALTAEVPAMVLWGDRDTYIPRSGAERFGAGKVRHYPDCGHWLHREAPDRVAADLAEFFDAEERP
jgi:pimeloyl-ACP methyl ester carboxylesterase